MGRRRQQGSSGGAARESGKRAEEEEVEVVVMGEATAAAAAVETAREKEKEKHKQKQKGKEAESRHAGRQFFKVFFPEQSAQRLRIPPPFNQYLQDEPTGLVSLKSPSGNTWQVALSLDSEGFCFTQGWKEFARDHSLKHGHFLVFTYVGRKQFSVVVFCSLGVEDPTARTAQPCNNIVVKVEDNDEGGQGGKQLDAGGPSEVSILPVEEGNAVTRKRTRGENDLIADGSASKRRSGLRKKDEKKRPESSKVVSATTDASRNRSRRKDTSVSLLNESIHRNKTHIRDKDVPRTGKFIVKRARQPVVISQRRPVTEEEKSHALNKAKEFKSKHPFSVQIMMESYVYVGFFMNISCEFVRESLPRTSRKMTLWDPLGKPWEVNYVYYSDRSVASFSGGWGKFALGNNLEKFDVCVFELFKEDNIRVHIYRVVPEITPLLRASNK